MVLLYLPYFILAFALDPYLVETKVQQDLENTLSKIIEREQFLIQVISDVVIKSERKVVEGETIINNTSEEAEVFVTPMPGFVPEPQVKSQTKPLQTRSVFRLVETPTLRSLKVMVNFDEVLPPATVSKGKQLVQNYLKRSYPTQAIVLFSQLKMLKHEKGPDKLDQILTKLDLKQAEDLKKEPKKEPPAEPPKPKPEEEVWNIARWGVLGLLLVILLLLTRKPSPGISQVVNATAPSANQSDSANRDENEKDADEQADEETGDSITQSTMTQDEQRKRLLDKFLIRSDAFREYYKSATEEQRSSLQGALKGALFDGLLRGLKLKSPENEIPPADAQEYLQAEQESFDEFVKARDWQERQFFGFLNQLTDEQLLTLIHHESPANVCLMLRFMKPAQSAFVLDALPQDKRVAILSHATGIQNTPLSEILILEKQVRSTVKTLPTGAGRVDLDFWGDILSEANDSQGILDAIQKTNPDIYPGLKKFSFVLESAPSLSKQVLERVLGDVDNEQLCLALATCPDEITQTLVNALPRKRRELVLSQMTSYQGISREDTVTARIQLTKKFREAVG